VNESHPPRQTIRSIGAVLAGLVTVFVLSLGTDVVLHATGVFPGWGKVMSDAMFVFATAYRLLYGVIGGYVTAWLAPYRPMRHALTLGIVGLFISIAGAAATWNAGPEFGPKWYPLALVVTAIPCAWAGGKLYELQPANRTQA
jgi:hypothetical protein